MKEKKITVCLYDRIFSRGDWTYSVDEGAIESFVCDLDKEFSAFSIRVVYVRDSDVSIEINGYADLLNSVRIRSPYDCIGNLCLGHIIGSSSNRDLFEDIRRGVSRVAFAPETVEPEGSNKVVCHNCGCGC